MMKTIEIGSLIYWRGSLGIVIDYSWEEGDGQEPEYWIRVHWHDSNSTWEEWETNMDLFEVIG